MFASIRWRLVASYVLLTLLAVGAVGVLTMWAVKKYVQEQEDQYLRANAQSIANQALPLLWPETFPAELSQLARAGSFFGNFQVRILDAQGRVLADSGNPLDSDEYAWLILPDGAASFLPGSTPRDWILSLLPTFPQPFSDRKNLNEYAFLDHLPPEVPLTIIRRQPEPWGTRLTFGTATVAELKARKAAQGVEESPAARSPRVVTVPVGRTESPAGYVELSGGMDISAEAMNTVRRAFLLGGTGALLLAGFFGLWMGRRLSAPLLNLTQTTAQMSAGDLSVRASVQTRDEIGKLAAQFNLMAGQLQASFTQLSAERDTLRRFMADASHELRTPITALKNFNELLQGAAAGDPQARDEFLSESQAQLERLEWITQNLLDLSRLDAGLAHLEIHPHNVGELVETAAAPFRARAAEKSINFVAAHQDPPLELACDRNRLEITLGNLLDNALKFTPAGGSVEIHTAQVGSRVQIRVRDSGAGIPPQDLPHIFERFYRGRNSAGLGSGLGLSIVQSIVHAHAGEIRVESPPDGGAVFILEFPGG